MVTNILYDWFLNNLKALIPKTSKTDLISIIQKIVIGSKANVVYIFELVISRGPDTYL